MRNGALFCFDKKIKLTKVVSSKIIGLVLREVSENKDLKLIQVAKRLQITSSTLSNYERGSK